MAILCFSDVLEKVGLDPADVKLIRHALTDRKFKECYDIGKVFEYTCHQKTGFSKGYSYWAVFISGVGTLAKFYALYQVGPSVPDTADMVPQGIPDSEAKEYRGENAVSQLKPVDILREYEGKLTIDWGNRPECGIRKGHLKSLSSRFSRARKRYFQDLRIWFSPTMNSKKSLTTQLFLRLGILLYRPSMLCT